MHLIRVEKVLSVDPPDIYELRRMSTSEGYDFVELTLTEWLNGTNRFDRPGEVFFLARVGDVTIGMCGLNADPFVRDPKIGRIRHLYVLPDYRRTGVGRRLVEACLTHAKSSFDRVRLRTFDPPAREFYAVLGFQETEEGSATHSMTLTH